MKSRIPQFLLGTLLLGCSACDTFKDVKSFFKPEAINQTRLEITVDPPSGFKLYLDDQLKTTTSPYTDATVAYGPHKLRITAPGYYPLEVPVEVKEGPKLSFSLALRSIPVEQAVQNGGVQVSGKAKKAAPTTNNAAGTEIVVTEEPAAAAGEQAVVTPAPVVARKPVTVRLGLDPECSVFLDGKKVGKGSSVPLVFKQSSGKLKVRFDADAAMNYDYQLDENGKLLIKPLGDGGWRRNGTLISESRYFLIGLQPQRFEANIGEPIYKQAAIFKIIEE